MVLVWEPNVVDYSESCPLFGEWSLLRRRAAIPRSRGDEHPVPLRRHVAPHQCKIVLHDSQATLSILRGAAGSCASGLARKQQRASRATGIPPKACFILISYYAVPKSAMRGGLKTFGTGVNSLQGHG